MSTPSGPPPSGPPASGPPTGPPGGPPTAGPAPGPPGAGPSGISRNQVVALVATGALAAGILVGVLAGGGGGDDKKDGSDAGRAPERTVRLEPIASATPNPFMASVGTDEQDVEPPEEVASAGRPQTYEGSLPGLYGGTRDVSSCDAEQMVEFLEANPSKAAAWAGALGIRTSEIRSYVSELTPVILRADTAVTNHGFVNGRANAIPAILQAGTAVLVDKYGVPRVKCFCGNPLTPPRYPADPVYEGPQWPAFQPGGVVIIDKSVTVINVITVIDLETNEPFGRPVGSDGTSDTDAPEDGAAPIERPGSAAEAEELIRNQLEECLRAEAQQPSSGEGFDFTFTPEETEQLLATLQYASTGPVDGIVSVRVTGPEGDFATWNVNVDTGDITPADPVAAEIAPYCPALG